MPPRWFYPLIGACVALATVTYLVVQLYRIDTGRWATSGTTAIDTRTGTICVVRGVDPDILCHPTVRPTP